MIMRRILSISLLALLPLPSFAALQCGPFYLQAKDDGLMRVNGVEPETQKIIFLKEKDDYANMKIQIMVLDKNLGRWLGMDYIRRESKPILNVEVIRKNMDEPRRFWSYDCQKKGHEKLERK